MYFQARTNTNSSCHASQLAKALYPLANLYLLTSKITQATPSNQKSCTFRDFTEAVAHHPELGLSLPKHSRYFHERTCYALFLGGGSVSLQESAWLSMLRPTTRVGTNITCNIVLPMLSRVSLQLGQRQAQLPAPHQRWRQRL